MSCARSAQKFCGKENNIKTNKNMKRTNGVRAAYDAFSYVYFRLPLGALLSLINTSKVAYPWPLIVCCHRCLASFSEAR